MQNLKLKTLENYRKEIDVIDEQLIRMFKKRFELSKKIGKNKKEIGKEINDNTREQEKLNLLKQLGQKYNINDSFINEIWKIIFKESKNIQEKDE